MKYFSSLLFILVVFNMIPDIGGIWAGGLTDNSTANRFTVAIRSGAETKDVISCAPESGNTSPGKPMEGKMNMKKLSRRYHPVPPDAEEIFSNDNRKNAGQLKGNVLTVDLEAREGAWFPESHDGESISVFSFAEKGKPLQLPGPKIRVTAGTLIKASVHNTLEAPLVLYGFCSRPSNENDSVIINPGDIYETSFLAGEPGTYFYRASASNNIKNGLPYFTDSQLYGAFIVDSAGQVFDPNERVIMIGMWNDSVNGTRGEELSLNGLSWPYTERLTYRQDQEVKWKIINASNQPHPMHLHGFYFEVLSKGNLFRGEAQHNRKAVTELLFPGETISIKWTPERPGNWLFHCHTLVHISSGSFLRKVPNMEEMDQKDLALHVKDGMGGLIIGLHVLPAKGKKWISKLPPSREERKLTMILKDKPQWYDTLTGKGIILKEDGIVSDNTLNVPGPTLFLNRNEPVSIKIINQLKEATTLHWHGLEIDSYFDGVSGWGNYFKKLAPLIQPGDSFVVHLTPPRSGTFIYHTHMHNNQLLAGMYGALIVKDKEQPFNKLLEKLFVIGQGGNDVDERNYFLNGKKESDTMLLKQGVDYRFRIINITALAARFSVSLTNNGQPVNWKLIAKDGADIASEKQVITAAHLQRISIGETMDYTFTPAKKGDYLFEVHDFFGKLLLSKHIISLE